MWTSLVRVVTVGVVAMAMSRAAGAQGASSVVVRPSAVTRAAPTARCVLSAERVKPARSCGSMQGDHAAWAPKLMGVEAREPSIALHVAAGAVVGGVGGAIVGANRSCDEGCRQYGGKVPSMVVGAVIGAVAGAMVGVAIAIVRT